GLELFLYEDGSSGDSARFSLDFENRGRSRITVLLSELAPTLFGKIPDGDDPFSPSDGISDARITRVEFARSSPVATRGPHGEVTSDSHALSLETKSLAGAYSFVLGRG